MRVHEINYLIVHLVGVLSARPNGPGCAVLEMIPHQLPPDAAKRFVDRGYLGQNVSAVTVLLHHFLQSANLPFDPAKSRKVPRFYFRIHGNRLSRAGRRIANGATALRSVSRRDLGMPGLCWHLVSSWL